MTNSSIRSPLFYTGDKYKLLPEIKKYFPNKMNRFIEPFVGGGSVFMNVEAHSFLENDLDSNIIHLHKYLSGFSNVQDIMNILLSKIKAYGLSCSYLVNNIPEDLRKKYVKTYFAKFNKDAYSSLKNMYNLKKEKDPADLYILLIYGFNRILRFNGSGNFNVPVGNVDFNQNVVDALKNYIETTNRKNISWSSFDYKTFIKKSGIKKGDFVYADPPYLITASEYNKLWNQEDDKELLDILDELNNMNVKFAMSNVTEYKGRKNERLIKWAEKYNVHPIKSNYINYHDNSIKKISEVLITNYE